MTSKVRSISVLACVGLGITLCWYLAMLIAGIWYFTVPKDVQGWDGLIVIVPGLYWWIPFSLLGGLLGMIAWLRIRARPETLAGRNIAAAAIILSFASPVVGSLAAYGLIALKKWLL